MEINTTTLNFEYGIASELAPNQLLTTEDEACFVEIKQILEKHRALNRFGVTLLDNEKLPEGTTRLETNSITERTLITQIVDQATVGNDKIQTNWTLNTTKAIASCATACSPAQGSRKHGGTSEHQSGGQAQ
ncbi:hypothetical protein [uncultured Microscilla sp.]|uniref:hypothetical protein n=1 Tax=uncultured Microscilla sp. TaxID=432653 RepID=UPI00262904D6|nr:hypothetical protein [uncultured Microscilla sp.]